MSIIADDNDFKSSDISEKKKHSVIKPECLDNDKNFENCIRPKTFDTYIGQTALKETLKISIAAAKKRELPLDHLLFYGPPGLGKTTLAGVIAEQMGVDIKITSAPALERPRDIIGILMSLKGGEILFIDEIHRLNKVAEEILYPAMEDFFLDMTTGKAQTVKTLRIPLPKFTLIGATTKAGELSGPLRDRFGIIHRLEFYTEDELSEVAFFRGLSERHRGAQKNRARGRARHDSRPSLFLCRLADESRQDYRLAEIALARQRFSEHGKGVHIASGGRFSFLREQEIRR